MRKLRELFRSISNLFIWFPTIWRDRWYSEEFLYKILKKKIDLMEEGHRTKSHIVNGERYARQLKLCSLLLDRMIKDVYFEKSRGVTVEEYYGYDLLEFIERHRGKTKTQEMLDKWNHEKEANLRKQDIDILFTQMKKHIQNWSD